MPGRRPVPDSPDHTDATDDRQAGVGATGLLRSRYAADVAKEGSRVRHMRIYEIVDIFEACPTAAVTTGAAGLGRGRRPLRPGGRLDGPHAGRSRGTPRAEPVDVPATGAGQTLCGPLCDNTDMATNLAISPDLLERALKLSGKKTKTAAVTLALQEFIARREQRGLLDLFDSLDWDPTFDYKAERSRG